MFQIVYLFNIKFFGGSFLLFLFPTGRVHSQFKSTKVIFIKVGRGHTNLIFYFIPLCIWDIWTWRLFLVLQTRSQYWQWYSEGKCFDSRWFFAWSLSLLTLPHNPHEMERSKFFVKYIFASSSIENETPSGRSPGESEGQIINGSLFNSSMLQRHVLSQAVLTMANFITETTWILRGKMFGF